MKRARCGVGGGRVHYTCRVCDQGLIRGNQVELLTSCSPPAHLLFTLCLTYARILFVYMVSIVRASSNHCSTSTSILIKYTDIQVISCSPPAHLLLTSCSPISHLLFTLCLTYARILFVYMVSIVHASSNHCSTNPSILLKCTDIQVLSCSPPACLLLTSCSHLCFTYACILFISMV